MQLPAVAYLAAHLVFWGLLVYAWIERVLTPALTVAIIGVWIVAYLGLPVPLVPRAAISYAVFVLDALLLMLIAGGAGRT